VAGAHCAGAVFSGCGGNADALGGILPVRQFSVVRGVEQGCGFANCVSNILFALD
jgi:hypothetical protein